MMEGPSSGNGEDPGQEGDHEARRVSRKGARRGPGTGGLPGRSATLLLAGVSAVLLAARSARSETPDPVLTALCPGCTVLLCCPKTALAVWGTDCLGHGYDRDTCVTGRRVTW